jgi:hypothetical protein
MEEHVSESPVLMGWKDIAQYLNMGVRTVQRYECEYELPIRRPAGGAGGTVIAMKAELDRWLAGRPKRKASCSPEQSAVLPASKWAAVQAGMSRMGELRKEMSQHRAEMRAALNSIHSSIRVVDAASSNLLRSIQVSTAVVGQSKWWDGYCTETHDTRLFHSVAPTPFQRL